MVLQNLEELGEEGLKVEMATKESLVALLTGWMSGGVDGWVGRGVEG